MKEFLTVLWEDNFDLPWDLLCLASDSIEKTAVELNISPVEFAREHIFSIDNGMLLPPLRAIEVIDSVLKTIFSSEPREALLDLAEKITPMTSPGAKHKIYNRATVDGLRKIHSVFEVETDRFPSFTLLLTNVCNESMTSNFGLAPFESTRIIGEMRSVQDVERIYGSSIGSEAFQDSFTEMTFEQFLSMHQIPVPPDVDLGKKVQCVKRDVLSACGYKVFTAGTAYNAPCVILGIGFKPELSQGFSIKHVLETIYSKDKKHFSQCKKAHERVLALLTDKYAFTFDRLKDTLFVNNHRITKGAPARVIAKILDSYLETGRNSFDNDFFSNDNSIIRNKIDKSLNITLKRAQRALSRSAPLLRLERLTGEGLVKLRVGCDLIYTLN